MSYARLSSFRGIEPWGQNAAETDEIYLWRATFQGAAIRTIEDVQAIAAALGKYNGSALSLRGVTVESSGSGNQYTVDGVLSTPIPRVFVLPAPKTASEVAGAVQTELSTRFPGLAVGEARWEVIDDSDPRAPALDFWLAHTVIWDWPFLEAEGHPTDAFGRFEGLYLGRADQGINLKPWPKDEPGFDKKKSDDGDGVELLLWLAGAAAVVWLVFSRAKGAA